MKPGDFIEWTYENNGQIVTRGEYIWSSVMECYVPVDIRHMNLLISRANGIITWVNNNGLFRARENDTVGRGLQELFLRVVPLTMTSTV